MQYVFARPTGKLLVLICQFILNFLQKSADKESTMRTADLATLNGSYKRQNPRLVSGLTKVISKAYAGIVNKVNKRKYTYASGSQLCASATTSILLVSVLRIN